MGLEHHRETLLENSRLNAVHCVRTIRDVRPDNKACLVISAGPSLQRERILARLSTSQKRPDLTIVCADGAYIQCLKTGIKPDWVITVDPSPRIARWFGQRVEDDYFKRQDLDVTIREEEENASLIESNKCPLVICSSASRAVEAGTQDFERYWFCPLVDEPRKEGSLTRLLSAGIPALNTGGTVGTTAVNFATSILGSQNIAVVGMDFGYYLDTPLEKTQEWEMLKGPNVHEYYPRMKGHWNEGFTSPTYYFYLRNFLDLIDEKVVNCSGAGFLQGPNIVCCELEEWLKSFS